MLIQGHLRAEGLHFVLVVSRFNEFITTQLAQAARDCFFHHGGKEENLDTIHVPGAWELPVVANAAAETGRYHGIVALGCVIRGRTHHFDYVAGEASKGLASVSLSRKIPVGFGVLTTDTVEQAIERAGPTQENRGWHACLAAIETVRLMEEIRSFDD